MKTIQFLPIIVLYLLIKKIVNLNNQYYYNYYNNFLFKDIQNITLLFLVFIFIIYFDEYIIYQSY